MAIDPLQAAEVIDWWSSQRHFVDTSCKAEAARISADAAARIDDLSTRDLFLPSDARRHLEAQARSDINVFNRRILRALDKELAVSLNKIEGIEGFGPEGREAALVALGGALGTGSIGLAVAASSVAATTVTTASFFGLIAGGTVTAVSWPVFAAAAIGATALAIASPRVIKGGTQMVRNRYKRHVASQVERSLVQGGKGRTSTRDALLTALDNTRQARLKGIP